MGDEILQGNLTKNPMRIGSKYDSCQYCDLRCYCHAPEVRDVGELEDRKKALRAEAKKAAKEAKEKEEKAREHEMKNDRWAKSAREKADAAAKKAEEAARAAEELKGVFPRD